MSRTTLGKRRASSKKSRCSLIFSGRVPTSSRCKATAFNTFSGWPEETTISLNSAIHVRRRFSRTWANAQAQKDAAALQYAKENHDRNEAMRKNGDVSLDALQQSASMELQDNAALAADRASIETAQLNLGYTEIRAPFAGRLSLSLVHEGALISVAGTQLNTLVQLDPIYATFNPADADLTEIQRYQTKAPIPVEVIVGEGAATAQYQGKLTFLDNTIGRSTGTITARATISNPHHTLLPGQFIRVRLHVANQPNTLLIPQRSSRGQPVGQICLRRRQRPQSRAALCHFGHRLRSAGCRQQGRRQGQIRSLSAICSRSVPARR